MNDVKYILRRSDRKTVSLTVLADGTVEVRAPLRFPKRDIDRFVQKKGTWIESRLYTVRERASSGVPAPEYGPGEFGETVSRLIAHWQSAMGVKASGAAIRSMKTRWGSCTPSTGRIRINSALERCPEECLEYVIVHELAHLTVPSHSKAFWDIVARNLPDHRERQERLNALAWILALPAPLQREGAAAV